MRTRFICFLALIVMTEICYCDESGDVNKKEVKSASPTKVINGDVKEKTIPIKFTDAKKVIIVDKSKPNFEITLQSNPTTGYSWFLKNYDNNIVKPVRHKFFAPKNTKLTGVPGYEKWTFRIKPSGFAVPQVTNILLIYTRPWEEQTVQPINFRVVTHNDN